MEKRKKELITYPVKLGFLDGSGKDENWITDSQERSLVNGQGDCCMIGGIQQRSIALAIISVLNRHRPRIYIEKKEEKK